MEEKPTGLEGYLRVSEVPAALGEVLCALALAGKAIASKVRRARIEDVVGAVGNTNAQGEAQQKLDVIANELLALALSRCPHVAVIASEEEEGAIVVRTGSEGGVYSVLFDPLDGSSNIDVAAGIGTIFSILPNAQPDADTAASVLQPGDAQVASGYVLYGSQVALVLTTGAGVDMFVLDPVHDAFVLVAEGLVIPGEQKIYAINEAYVEHFPDGYRGYLEYAHGDGYTSRFIGSMVADVHRTLIKGGLFAYPTLTSHPEGRLRLLYEANPLAFVVEQARGLASRGGARLLETQPSRIHQRTPVILGSPREVEKLESFLR